jgi:hypothetical protein
MFPGTSSSTTVTFRSSQNLTGAVVDVTPSLKDIVSVSPASFAAITAAQDYKVTLMLTAPPQFLKRSFGGTIHVRNSSTSPNTLPDPLSVHLQTDFQLASTSQFSFAYPQFGNFMPQISSTPDGTVSLGVVLPQTNAVLSAFNIHPADPTGANTLLDWFTQHVDPSNQLTPSAYTLTELPDGTSLLLLTGAIPADWSAGPLSQAFVMSPDNKTLLIINMSNDDPLAYYGISSHEAASLINIVATSISFK